MSLSPSDNSTVSAFLTTLSLEEHSHLTPDLGTVPIHNAFPIDSTHAALLRNYPLLSPCLDNLKHQFEPHQMEQYLIFDINTGLMEYQPQKTWWYWFHPYTSLMSTSSSRRTPSHLIKLTMTSTNHTLTSVLNTINDPSILQQSNLHPSLNHSMES